MNLAEIRLVLRPRTVFEVLDLALLFLRRSLPATWGLFGGVGVLWVGGVAVLSFLKLDVWPRTAILIVWMLFLRFWLQVFLVLACGRLAFAERLRWSEVFADLRTVGRVHIIRSGLWRAIKWVSGFGLLLPLWIVLVRRFFDYEHWLLERLRGPEVGRRLQSFQTDSRVFNFRVIHGVFLLLAMGLGYEILKISIESLTRGHAISPVSPELFLSVFLLYDPFFIVSRFLLYIQIRTDNEAWDIGLLLREGIYRTLVRTMIPFLFAAGSLIIATRSLIAAPAPEADAATCTEAMRQQPWLKCDPAGYRSYSVEEVEEHIPRQPEQRQIPDFFSGLAGLARALFYGLVGIALFAILYYLWRRFARGVRAERPEAPSPAVWKEHGMPIEGMDMAALVRSVTEAMEREAWKEALGWAYLALLKTQPLDCASLTPLELRHRFEGHPAFTEVLADFFSVYAMAFYAGRRVDADVAAALLRRMIEFLSAQGMSAAPQANEVVR